MECDYQVGVLGPIDVYRAFAVMQPLVVGLDLERWKSLTATEELRRDWLAVAEAKGYIRGLCHVFTRDGGSAGRIMEVPIFASVSLFDEKGVARRLFTFAKDRAKLEGCSMIHFWSIGPRKWDSLVTIKETTPPEGGLLYDMRTDRAAAGDYP
ncbi:hypothetical protein [Neorhizobium petrolearium]|uniref:hypothetical protein n=1 Tax=Neorhizobium petrolearium TaxID=515361 RepID=UPI003F7CDF81